jgi:hypothetical protein
MPIPDWPKGPTFYAEQHMRPYFPTDPPSLLPYRNWGADFPTTVWSEAGRCKGVGAGAAPPGWGPTVAAMQGSPDITNPYALAWWMQNQGFHPSGAGQSGDEAWFAELLADRQTPTEARPYLQRGEWPPTPGSRTYSSVIKPQFIDRADEQHYIDWWYAHFTTDAPRYTLPPIPPASEPPADEPPAWEPPVRPPRDWPAQEPLEEPDEPDTTITTTGTPTTAEEPSRTPWGWIVGGSAALLLIGGGVAYVVTRPKRRSDGSRRRRRRR